MLFLGFLCFSLVFLCVSYVFLGNMISHEEVARVAVGVANAGFIMEAEGRRAPCHRFPVGRPTKLILFPLLLLLPLLLFLLLVLLLLLLFFLFRFRI